MVTATTAEVLAVSARTLGWQTQRPVRIVDPDGNVVREMEPERPPGVTTPAG